MRDVAFKELSEISAKKFENSPLGKMSEGKIFDKPTSEYDKPLGSHVNFEKSIKKDDNGKQYINESNELLPNTSYVLGGNVFNTDEMGRISTCESTPKKTPENPRDIKSQIMVGGKDRRENDQGGHIVGRDMGGDGGLGNLIPMDSRINQSDYKRMENELKRYLDEGKKVETEKEFIYKDNSARPDHIHVKASIDGKINRYLFDNNVDGSLMGDLNKTCNKSDIALIEIGGEISSIKEEYNTNEKLEKTTVTVTSKDENGNNYRENIIIKHNGGFLQ